MGKGGWHHAPWIGSLQLLRGEESQKPPIGYLPDRGPKKQRNHRWLGAMWHLLYWKKFDKSHEFLRITLEWAKKSAKQELSEGIGVHGSAVEVFMPDPHTAYDVLPRLVFLIDAIERNEFVDEFRKLWRWQLFAWNAGATPDGQIVLPCTRVVTPLSQVADACYRILNGLPHRNNRWQMKTWDQWWKMFQGDLDSGLWAAEHFRRAITEYGKETLFNMESRPELESPLLAYPIIVERRKDGHTAVMFENPKYQVIAPCYTVKVSYIRKGKPMDGVEYKTDKVTRFGVKSERMSIQKAI